MVDACFGTQPARYRIPYYPDGFFTPKACVACHMEEEVLSPMLEKVSKARTSAPEKAVECAAASKLKGRRIQMGTPCK